MLMSGMFARFAQPRPVTTKREGRGFFLEEEPVPEPVPGRWEPRRDSARMPNGDELVIDPRDGDVIGVVPAPGAALRDALPPGASWTSFPDYGAKHGPTPLADELRRDRELLEAANGRLVARVRALEAQLRAAGIEPAARE